MNAASQGDGLIRILDLAKSRPGSGHEGRSGSAEAASSPAICRVC